MEFIAEALKKPENVHLNLEPSDYIQDPSLHSVYKAHYVERKLIRPDYDPKEKSKLCSVSFVIMKYLLIYCVFHFASTAQGYSVLITAIR